MGGTRGHRSRHITPVTVGVFLHFHWKRFTLVYRISNKLLLLFYYYFLPFFFRVTGPRGPELLLLYHLRDLKEKERGVCG